MLATIIICLVLACIVGAIIANMIKKHKNGAPACGCGCKNCSMSSVCHTPKK